MIRANELRIGNLAYRTNKSTGKRDLIQITPSCIMDISANGERSSFIYEPIPLTEEWLVRFGFSKGILFDTILYLSGTRWHISYHDGIYQLNYKENPSSQWVPVLKDIKHVHTLQNLFWILCGEELTLKE